MLNEITISKERDPDISLIYEYKFKTRCEIDNASNVMGVDLRDAVFDAVLYDFKVALYKKIFSVSTERAIKSTAGGMVM